MITLSNLKEEEKYRKRVEKLLAQGRIDEAKKVWQEHERLINIRQEFKCSEITSVMTPEHKELTNFYLRKICILTDIVDGAGVDMLELLRKYEDSLSLPLLALIGNLRRTAREITSIVDAVGDNEYVCSFGEVCDEVDRRIKELFNKGAV